MGLHADLIHGGPGGTMLRLWNSDQGVPRLAHIEGTGVLLVTEGQLEELDAFTSWARDRIAGRSVTPEVPAGAAERTASTVRQVP